MNNSILLSIKKLLGIDRNDNAFDQDIIIHINTVLNVLYQLGIGKKNYFITGEKETWIEYFENGYYLDGIELIKSYIYLKVRLLFDPPTTGVLHEAMERQISELEWRINFQAEGGMEIGQNNDVDGSTNE